jgi:ABC-type amino acid transport system permease subunit
MARTSPEFRSLKAIDRVQFDAAKSIGLSSWQTFLKVILPQVLVFSIPSLGNQVVLLLKDTSLLSAISVAELTMQAKLLTEQTGAAYQAFAVVAVLYLLLVTAVEMLARFAHRSVHGADSSWRRGFRVTMPLRQIPAGRGSIPGWR